MKTKHLTVIAVLAPLLWTAGCAPRESSTQFRMPEGNADRGRSTFVALDCVQCHRVMGVDLPAPTVDAARVVTLGGDVTKLRSYGDLITSIIHPSQRLSELMPGPAPADGKSPMPSMTERMTVAQLIDLVTFLQPRYSELEPLYQPHPYYGP